MATVAFADETPATPEEIWAILRETARRQKEADERFELERAEYAERFEREKAESAEQFRREKAEYAERQRAADERQKAADERFEREKAENAERQKAADERQKAADERQKAADERFEQQKAQNDRIIGELSKNMYGLNLSMGQLIETLIAARLWEKFAAYPYNLNRAYRRMPIFGEGGRTLTEIDILLADTEWVMAVEVKREYDDDRDLTRHLQRMEQIRKHPPEQVMDKKLLGAIAGGVVSPMIRELAHESGFFVLELKGEAVDLVQPPEGFAPAEW